MDIQEKILKVINYSVGEGGIDTSSNEMVDAILSLIRKEIESAIPKEKDVMYSGLDVYKHQQVVCLDKVSDWGKKVGYNQALSDIRTALQRKGLI